MSSPRFGLTPRPDNSSIVAADLDWSERAPHMSISMIRGQAPLPRAACASGATPCSWKASRPNFMAVHGWSSPLKRSPISGVKVKSQHPGLSASGTPVSAQRA